MSPKKEDEQKVKKFFRDYENNKTTKNELSLSKWIKENKALLVTAGSITVAGAKTIAWIIINIDEIIEFVEIVSPILKSDVKIRTLDLDILTIDGILLDEILCHDTTLIDEVLKKIIIDYNFDQAYSKKYNKYFLE